MDLAARLAAASRPLARPAGGALRAIAPEDLRSVAAKAGLSPREAEIAALRAGIAPERYLRNFASFSLEEQVRLLSARVAVAGLGGLGGHLLEILARAGTGRIRACDGDRFEPANLNRQLFCTEDVLGRPKALAARERLRLVNSSVEFEAEERFLEAGQWREFVDGADLAVDCLGGLRGRLELQRAASEAGIPLVTAAMAGLTAWVATVLPGAEGPADFFGADGPAGEDVLGTPPQSVALAASLQAAECLAQLSGRGPGLAGRMLLADLSVPSFEIVRLSS